MLRVAITRALPEAEATAARVRELGGAPVIAPLLTIVPCGYDTNIEDAQALVFTSINGVRAFPAIREAQDKIILAVGDATAAAAHAAGHKDVRSADGDVASLAALAKTILDPTKGKIIHIAGEHIAGDLAGVLQTAGYQIERRTAYAAVQASTLPPQLKEPLDIVLFYSARAAEAFVAFGAPNSAQLTAACMSPGVAEKAATAAWKRIIVAPAPREDDLLRVTLQE